MTFGQVSTEILMPVFTLAAVVVALWASISTSRESANRDKKSREVAAYERWVEKFFKLGQVSTEPRPKRRESIQDIKSHIEIYRAHLANTQHVRIARAFSEHASKAVQLHEIAEFLYAQDSRRKPRFGQVQIDAYTEWNHARWYDDYRFFIRSLSATMSKVSADLSLDCDAADTIDLHDKKMAAKYAKSFKLVEAIEKELGTLGAL